MNIRAAIDKFTDVQLPAGMGRHLETYDMHDVITVGTHKQKTYQGTVNICKYGLFICLGFSAYFGLNHNFLGTYMPIAPGILCLWGYLLFRRLRSNLVFDYVNGMYYRDVILDETKIDPVKQGSLSEIKQFVVSKKRNPGNHDKPRTESAYTTASTSYRLEMELIDGSRHLIMHRAYKGTEAYAVATHLSQRINVPAYGPDGLIQESERVVRKYQTSKSSRLTIDDNEFENNKQSRILSTLLIAALLSGGGYLAYKKYSQIGAAPHVSHTLSKPYLKEAIVNYYAKRFDGDFVMTSIDKIIIVPVDDKIFDVHTRYQFAPSRPESGIGYYGTDQRIFKFRINNFSKDSASISILSMGKNNSADFALGELHKALN